MSDPIRFSTTPFYTNSQPLLLNRTAILSKDTEQFLVDKEADWLGQLNRVPEDQRGSYIVQMRQHIDRLRDEAQVLTFSRSSNIRAEMERMVLDFESSLGKFYTGNALYEKGKEEELASNSALQGRFQTSKFKPRTYSSPPETSSSSYDPLKTYLKFQLATHIVSTEFAARVVDTATTVVVETAKGICSYSEESKQACKGVLDLATKSGKAVVEYVGLKEPIKKVVEVVNSFDGASMAATLEVVGVKKEAAAELGSRYASSMKTSTALLPIPVVKPLVAAVKLGAKGVRYTSTLANRAIQPLARQPFVAQMNRSIAQSAAIFGRTIQGVLQMPAPAYIYISTQERLALRSLRLEENRFVFRDSGATSFKREGAFNQNKLYSSSSSGSSGKDWQTVIQDKIRGLEKLRDVHVPRDRREMIRYHEMIGYQQKTMEGKGAHIKMVKADFPVVIISSNTETYTYNWMWKRFKGFLEDEITYLKNQLEPSIPEILFAEPIQQPIANFITPSVQELSKITAFAENLQRITADVYSWIKDCSHNKSMFQAVIELEEAFSEIIPRYDHTKLPREELAAKLINEKASVIRKELLGNNSTRLRMDNGKSYIYLEGDAETIFNKFLAHDLFPVESHANFRTAEVVALGQKEGVFFLVTTEIPGETLGYLGKKVGSTGSFGEKKASFSELVQASMHSGKKLGQRQSIPVKEPMIAKSSMDFSVFQAHLERANEYLRQVGLSRIQLTESHLKKVSDLNRKPIQYTQGVGTHISLHHLVWSPVDKTVGLLDIGLLPSLTSVGKVPLHCPAKELYAFFHSFDKGLLDGLTAEETLKLKNAFKKGYFVEAKIEIPKPLQDYYNLYYAIDTISELARTLVEGGKMGVHVDKFRHELGQLIEQLNSQRFA